MSVTTVKEWIRSHPYCLAVLYFIPYLIYFELLENFQSPRFTIHCVIDDWIPFHESFIIPYFLWFPLLAGSLAYFLFRSKEEFLNLCFLMFSGMTISLLIYTILPNGLDLRPEVLHDNLLADIARMLYTIDTPTNVCPSIHVSSTVAIMIVFWKSESLKHPRITKILIMITGIAICLSTMILKQHSFIDVVCGVLLTVGLYVVTYRMNWRRIFSHTFLRKIVA